jgi:hypothetical protein
MIANDSLPLGFGFLEIDQQADGKAEGPEIVETLHHVLVVKPLDAFQLQDEDIFNDDVGEIFTDVMAFIADGKRGFLGPRGCHGVRAL